jgi:hypothetical protein
MGWWNDFWSEDSDLVLEHERVTERLFPAVLRAVASAANAFEA